jgi:hypothetical protein
VKPAVLTPAAPLPRARRGHCATRVPGAARWRIGRGLASGSLAVGSRARAQGQWEGCAGQGGNWRDSPRRSGVGWVAGRDRCGGVSMADDDAPCYPTVLRAGGRGEAEPKWEKMGRREHDDSSYLGEGTTSMARPNSRCKQHSDGGGGQKSNGERGFCPWGALE